MADYSITFARSARKELESLNASLVERIFPKIEALASPGLHQNAPGLFHLPGKQAIAKNLGLVERLDFVRDCMK